ncbi:hypothetical protein AC578_4874 [Pseudocercospora eumusae]|uniref:Fe2OG dioxygenase domain-containing protein n=1 Tax=Pseudocercospora eumusae TaxID=321146 RepID=A0A139HC67_9PEZI|nr:hypothetical protein AC578_4874 [Pseudocercospora eumusae]
MGSMGEIPVSIPTIDISPFLADDSSPAAAEVVASVRDACREYGFFYLMGHGVPEEKRQEVLECTRKFASLSEEEKMEVWVGKCMGKSFRGYEPPALQLHQEGLLPDTKEAFIFGREVRADEPDAGTFSTGPNLWPRALRDEEFRLPLMAYHERMLQLTGQLSRILGRGLPKEWKCGANVFDALLPKPSAPMRLLHYKPQEKRIENQFGVGDHTDFGCISVLLQQENTEGLEVFHPRSQTWIPVPVKAGSYVINMGDMMQRLTNGYYRSARHRVLTNTTTRLSAPFFLNGNLDHKWRALDGSSDEEMTIGGWVRQRLADTIGGEAGAKLK